MHRPGAQGHSAGTGRADQGAAAAAPPRWRSSGQFSDTATGLVNDAGDDLVTNLKNLEPILKALADIGPDLNLALLWATAFPYGPTFADRVTRGDYINLFAMFDLTYPRLKKTLFLGTRWGDENAKLIPAPGDPYYLNYSYDPMKSVSRRHRAKRCRLRRRGAGHAAADRTDSAGGPAADLPRPGCPGAGDHAVADLRRAVRRRGACATRRRRRPAGVPPTPGGGG